MHLLRRARYLAAPLLLLSAWGWLELLHALRLPGPGLVDALPLYEGSRRDTLPVVTVVVVWLSVAAVACLPFRPRPAWLAASMLGVAIFSVSVVIQGAQLELARQADVGIDVHGALRTSFPWVAAALCSLVAAALWSRPRAAPEARPGVDDEHLD